ncbi:lysR substrate binding domain protein [Bordetella holmesii 44057]|nr:lysR substrate binding domain protein [Bordetella holmesii 44057]
MSVCGVVPGVSLSLLGQVDAGEVDLVVQIRPPFALPPELAWQALLSEPMVLAVKDTMPLRPWRDLLETEPFIRYERSSFGGRLVDRFLRRHRIEVQEAVELDEIDALANLVRAGLGVAILPHTRWLNRTGLRLIELGEPDFVREIGLIGRLSRSAILEKMGVCLQQASAEQAGPAGPAATPVKGDRNVP